MKRLLVTSALLLATAGPTFAGPEDGRSACLRPPACAATQVPRGGFLLPTLAVAGIIVVNVKCADRGACD